MHTEKTRTAGPVLPDRVGARWQWVAGSLLFVLALAPRAAGLAEFVTLDEYLWLDRSRNFVLALAHANWAGTLQTGHPGVVTMWSGALGLWAYGLYSGLIQAGEFTRWLQQLTWSSQPLAVFPFVRAPLVVLTASSVPAIFLLVYRLYGFPAALAAGVLVALDPWYIGHSRILHHDANLAALMTVSALALAYALAGSGVNTDQNASRQARPAVWALPLAGACAGGAVLCKSLGIFLLPWTAGALLLAVAAHRLRPWGAAVLFAVWLPAAVLAMVVFWPALWLEPLGTVQRMGEMLLVYAENPHETGQYWFGAVVADPGPWFYPVVVAFAATPIVLLGIGVKIVEMGAWLRRERVGWRNTLQALLPDLLLCMYVVGYLAMITLGDKKHERYALPALVMLDVLGGIGLAAAAAWVMGRAPIGRPFARWIVRGAFALLICGQCWLAARQAPYYFTFYNPLVGGTAAAASTLLVGIGEGSEQAADYLNSLPDAPDLHVVASLANVVAPFMRGQAGLWQPDNVVFAADYLVLYRRERQLGLPSRAMLDYITAAWPLRHTVEINDVPYAWVYQAPAADWVQSGENLAKAPPGLLAYKRDGEQLHLYRLYEPAAPAAWSVRSGARSGSPHSWNLTSSTPLKAPSSQAGTRGRERGQQEYGIQELVFAAPPAAGPGIGASAEVGQIEVGVAETQAEKARWWLLPTTEAISSP